MSEAATSPSPSVCPPSTELRGAAKQLRELASAGFVATMNPPVALLLADLLEDEARLEFGAVPDTPLLLARAILGTSRAYLGEDKGGNQ